VRREIASLPFAHRHPEESRRSAELIRRAIDTKAGIVSYQVVQEFFNLALRRFARPMSGGDAERIFGAFGAD
jgi:predicted nucleic acid-binding protein